MGDDNVAVDVKTGKFNSKRTGLLPHQQRILLQQANAGEFGDEPEDDNAVTDDQASLPQGENGKDWI